MIPRSVSDAVPFLAPRTPPSAPPPSRFFRRRTDFVVVHCAATPPSFDIGAVEIAEWHRRRGFRAIGYHFVIRRSGVVEPGRPIDHRGAHAAGVNAVSLGVCLVGGVSGDAARRAEDNFTAAQKDALWRLLDDLAERYPRAVALGHRDLPGVAKACPSFDVASFLVQRRVAEALT